MAEGLVDLSNKREYFCENDDVNYDDGQFIRERSHQDNDSYAKKIVLKDSSSSTQEETNMSYERPKTSRGHRSAAEEHFIEEQNAPVQQEKPIMRRSNKKSVFSNANSMNESDRPSTGMGFYESPGTPNNLMSSPTVKSNQGSPKRDRPASGYFITPKNERSPKNERPKTGYGRRGSEPRPAPYDGDLGRPESRYSHSPESIPETPRPPSSIRRARPKSAKGRPRPSYGAVVPQTPKPYTPRRERSFSAGEPFNPERSPSVSPRLHTASPRQAMRPTSAMSLNKYNPLPSIGQKATPSPFDSGLQREKTFINNGDDTTTTQLSHALDTQLRLSTRQRTFQEPANFETSVSKESPEPAGQPEHKPLTRHVELSPEPREDEDSLVLAVKLPDGRRIQHRFRPTQNVESVIKFAEHSSQIDFTGYKLVSNTMPKREFNDLKLNIESCNLENRTLLHLQTPD